MGDADDKDWADDEARSILLGIQVVDSGLRERALLAERIADALREAYISGGVE